MSSILKYIKGKPHFREVIKKKREKSGQADRLGRPPPSPEAVKKMWINSQSLEDTQVGYISQKYTLDKYTLEEYTLEEYTLENF